MIVTMLWMWEVLYPLNMIVTTMWMRGKCCSYPHNDRDNDVDVGTTVLAQ